MASKSQDLRAPKHRVQTVRYNFEHFFRSSKIHNFQDNWHKITNLYGRCLQYIPPKEVQEMDRKSKKSTKIKSFWRFSDALFHLATEMRLEFVVAFNDSDSTAGWFQFFLGTTLYLSRKQVFTDSRLLVFIIPLILNLMKSTVEETLDPMYSLNLRYFIHTVLISTVFGFNIIFLLSLRPNRRINSTR